jgi:MFS family permease
MPGSSSDNEIGTEPFDLAEFIDEYSSLFVTMGVFGALALYISQTSPEELTQSSVMIKMGFVASFLIAILIFALIYRQMLNEFDSKHQLIRAHVRVWENPALAAFTFLAALLGSSVSFILVRHQPIILMMGFLAVGGLGYILGLNALYWVAEHVPKTPYWRIGTILSTSFIVLVITLYLRMNVLDNYQLTTINQLSLSDPVPIFIDIALLLVASLQSMAALGILAGLIGIPVVIIDKIRGVSPYDEQD